MNRCRKCNTELTEQARFCNICGSPRTPASPQVEVSTSTKQETPDQTHRCHKCKVELSVEASFCNVCGTAQRSKASSTAVTPSEKQVILAPADADNKTLSDTLQQQKTLIPTRSIHPGIKKPSSHKVGDNSIHPKTITRSPVVPSRPTNNGVKSPAALPQRNTLQSALSPELATSATSLNTSSPANAPTTAETTKQPDASRPVNSSTASSSAKAEGISNTPTQPLEEPYAPARTPGLIRPITPKPPVHSVIPSRPDTQGTTTATPSYLLSLPPAKVSPPAKPQTQQRSSSSHTLSGTSSQDNKQNAVPTSPQISLPKKVSIDLVQRDRQKQKKRTLNFGTWITLFFMICLIAGLAAYIIWSYLPDSPFGITHTMPPVNATQPTLTVQGTTSQTVILGHTIQLHGVHFGAYHTITFLLDTASPIADVSGKKIASETNSQGTFDTTLTIDNHWTTGSHSIEAVDNSSNLNAFMALQVIPAGTPITRSTELSVTMDNKAVQMLTF